MGKTYIHLDLCSMFIQKTNIDKISFGLFKYADDKGYKAPFIFTANTDTEDITYLGALKNNNIRVLDSPPLHKVDILFNIGWKKMIPYLSAIVNMPVFVPPSKSRVCIYIDWDNIQVSYNCISNFIKGIKQFICNIKVHHTYNFYVFLHKNINNNVKSLLVHSGAKVVNIIKDKSSSGDGEMLRFIRTNTEQHDSICIASGDRDFSPLMIEYVRTHHNIFLIYNKQTLHTFKHNRHWLGSTNVYSIEGVSPKDKLIDTTKKKCKTKPCKFYNLSICKAINCSFLHICGICGRPHRMQDFHPGKFIIKNTICKKYNQDICPYSSTLCNHLHICLRCKKPHKYINCRHIIMYCPLCEKTMKSTKEYIYHHLSSLHTKRIAAIKKVVGLPLKKNNHVLIT